MDDPNRFTVAEAPAADQPLIPTAREPALAIEGGAGVLGYIGGTAALGPAWNVRLTANLSNRFALEANYTGAVNESHMGVGNDNVYVLTAIDGGVRYNILRGNEAPVQPFVVAGIGYAGYAGDDGDPFTMTIPVSAGVERMMSENIKIGARFNLRPALFDEIGPADEDGERAGGDTWSVLGHLGGAF